MADGMAAIDSLDISLNEEETMLFVDFRAKAGECSMNPGNMMMFCMKSCDFCDKGADVMHTWRRLETVAGSQIRRSAS
nr:hypothetical protein BaRGS_013629 [Batillaria attramentaria]